VAARRKFMVVIGHGPQSQRKRDPPIWSTRPMIDSLLDRTQIRRICAPVCLSATAWLVYGHAADRPAGAGARHTGGHFAWWAQAGGCLRGWAAPRFPDS
jgi:hypothetical protein